MVAAIIGDAVACCHRPGVLALVAETDLVAAIPRRFVAMHGGRFGVTAVEAPLAINESRIRLIAPKVAMMDGGIAWLWARLAAAWLAAGTSRQTSSDCNLPPSAR